MRITRSPDCRNSPRNAFVEDLAIDLFTGASLAGKLEASAEQPLVPDGITGLEITHAISHGKVGAANGTITVKHTITPFAIFVEFTSTKATRVKKLDLYGTGLI